MDVICLGLLVADVLVQPVDAACFDRDTTRVDDIQLLTGGDAMNAALNLSRLGFSVDLVGRVGDDYLGRFILNTLRNENLPADGVIVDPETTTATAVALITSQGERTFLYRAGANDRFCPADVVFDRVRKAKILHVGGMCSLSNFAGDDAATIFRRARELGLTTTCDVTWDNTGRWLSSIRSSLPYIDIFLPSINEAKYIAETERPSDIAKRLLDLGVKTAVVKLGAQGCYIRSNDQEHSIDGFKVDVVDTTGAGDAFTAGFIAGVLKGWDTQDCGRFANAVGALCVQQVGATSLDLSFQKACSLMASSG